MPGIEKITSPLINSQIESSAHEMNVRDPLLNAHLKGIAELNKLIEGNHVIPQPVAYGWGFNGIDDESSRLIQFAITNWQISQDKRENAKTALKNYKEYLEDHLTFLGCFNHSQSRAVWDTINSKLLDLSGDSSLEIEREYVLCSHEVPRDFKEEIGINGINEGPPVNEDPIAILKQAFPTLVLTDAQQRLLRALDENSSLTTVDSPELSLLPIEVLHMYAKLCGPYSLQKDLESMQLLFKVGNVPECPPASYSLAKQTAISNIIKEIEHSSRQVALTILEKLFNDCDAPEFNPLFKRLQQYVQKRLNSSDKPSFDYESALRKKYILEIRDSFLGELTKTKFRAKNEIANIKSIQDYVQKMTHSGYQFQTDINKGQELYCAKLAILLDKVRIVDKLEIGVREIMNLLNREGSPITKNQIETCKNEIDSIASKYVVKISSGINNLVVDKGDAESLKSRKELHETFAKQMNITMSHLLEKSKQYFQAFQALSSTDHDLLFEEFQSWNEKLQKRIKVDHKLCWQPNFV